jgi:hypothetical protein
VSDAPSNDNREQEPLESPVDDADLYLARSDEVSGTRPFLTGDVFGDVAIAGLEDSSGYAMVLTHPCSMRSDGVHLESALLMCRVATYQRLGSSAWSGHVKVFPLPSLFNDDRHFAARLDKIGLVASGSLAAGHRVACLSPIGIGLCQQRLIRFLTRFVVPTHKLHETFEAVLEEVDLMEEWLDDCVGRGGQLEASTESFHGWIRAEDATSQRRQDQLSDPQRRSTVRREMRRELEARASQAK